MKTDAAATPPWHALEAAELEQRLDVQLQHGLSAADAKQRLAEHGPNEITRSRGTPAWLRFLLQFHQPLLYILLGATVVSIFLGEWVDAGVIFGVVFINALVGYLQESKAEKAISALAQMVVPEATVRRDGEKLRVPSAEIVPGDVVLLESGDSVPADLRLLHVRGLQADEAPLTGESQPIYKNIEPLAEETVLADRKNLAFAGTAITSGRGEGVVFATGDRTEVGRIATLITGAVSLQTPLTRKIAQFSKLLLWLILGFAAVTVLIGLWRGGEAGEMFMAAVAIAVAAIPEGLPAAVTITLAIGVSRMARRRAIIRKLPAVETLGSTTVICSDKTGTLTENQMTVQEIFAGGETFRVSGVGYAPEGEISKDDAAVVIDQQPALAACLRAGLLCNDARLVQDANGTTIQGDPTEAALIVAAEKAGLLHAEHHAAHPRVDAIPFESEHQFMATLHDTAEEGGVIYKKGAEELLVGRCSTMLNPRGEQVPIDSAAIHRAADEMAARGLRVLAFARRAAEEEQRDLEHHHVQAELTFLGLQGMIDPPRPAAVEAVKRCHDAGIQVKMITGDHVLTAKAIAEQIGLARDKNAQRVAISGSELANVPEAELPQVAEEAVVFARVTPEQKLRLVESLQSRGHIVAMTGDGVNDAPALKQADIGIAMGITGTDVAKGAAAMVLTDDNFASIEAAVHEGRGVFDNLTKFILWTLPTNGGQGLILMTAIFLGTALPALAVQILWINMMTALLLGLMLVFEPKENDLMQRPPRDPGQPILTFPLVMRSGLVMLLMLLGAFGMFLWVLHRDPDAVAVARTAVVNTVVMVQIFYLLNCRSLNRSMFSIGLFSNPWIIVGIVSMLVAQSLFTYAPVMQRLFHTAPLAVEHWMMIVATGLAVYLAVGFEKWVRFRRGDKAKRS